jgi:hypothetical protein
MEPSRAALLFHADMARLGQFQAGAGLAVMVPGCFSAFHPVIVGTKHLVGYHLRLSVTQAKTETCAAR